MAGRGTPDSAGGWQRGPDTPLSGSPEWLQSYKKKKKKKYTPRELVVKELKIILEYTMTYLHLFF